MVTKVNKSNKLRQAQFNLDRGDNAADVAIKGDNVEEIAAFFMDMFSGSNEKTNIASQNQHAFS
ncbi:hypothetical protein K0H59_05265 [Shewanella sp. FJAT-51649]|uniref:hypothetical protein n=1 Tax=Shewanella sp. FJAT-51649 TaxID=2864210 RepID=UPI001C65A10E|nr:hypothetical protein [Shewanella sp. FJAT-51649]QYJ72467.1 hypothetical protein K0H59_05265 [Shewanella sp. FJAT-51649]